MKMALLLIFLLGAAIPAAFMTYAGLEHNAMMEFCSGDPESEGPCVLDLEYTVLIFGTWYLFSLGVMVLFYAFIRLVTRRRRPRAGSQIR